MAGKKWLENKKPPNSPSTENFPEIPKNTEPIFTANNPKSTKRPIIKITLPSFTEQKILIQPKPHEQEILTKITDHQPINPLREQPTKKELILLVKIKQLEEQLRKTQALVDQEKKRADKAEQLLQKIVYCQQLEKEQNPTQRAQIIQSPPLKIK